MMIILTFALLLVSLDAHAAGRVFYDGFESGSFDPGWSSGWADGDGIIPASGNKGHDNTVLPEAGNRQMECWYENPAGNTWFCNYIAIDTLYTDEIFVRLWMRLDQDVQANQGSMAHILRFYAGGGLITDVLVEMLGDNSGNVANTQLIADAVWNSNRPSNSPQFYSYNPGIGDNAWHKYEMYLNNATHVYKLWQDDVLKMSLSDAMINYHFGNFIPLHNWGSPKPTDLNTHFYFDEVEVYSDLGSRTFTGTMAAGDIADTGGGGGGGSTAGGGLDF